MAQTSNQTDGPTNFKQSDSKSINNGTTGKSKSFQRKKKKKNENRNSCLKVIFEHPLYSICIVELYNHSYLEVGYKKWNRLLLTVIFSGNYK